jgi:hypothetical protein
MYAAMAVQSIVHTNSSESGVMVPSNKPQPQSMDILRHRTEARARAKHAKRRTVPSHAPDFQIPARRQAPKVNSIHGKIVAIAAEAVRVTMSYRAICRANLSESRILL